MKKNIIEKILSHASGEANLTAGQIINCKIDLLMGHDSSGPRIWGPYLKKLNLKPFNEKKVVVITDHYIPANDLASARIGHIAREFAAAYKINFHDSVGICHIVLEEQGYIQPGMFAMGGDSHSPTAGAFGAFMCGYGELDTFASLVTGETWEIVPSVIKVNLNGKLAPYCSAKDIALFLAGNYSFSPSEVIEYGGSLLAELPMEERMVLTNMSPEIGVMTSIINPDQVTEGYFLTHGNKLAPDYPQWCSDEGAQYARIVDIDVTALEPQLAKPHNPGNTSVVRAAGIIKLDQCYIGACTGAKYSDLVMAAAVLKNKTVAPHVRLLLAPASRETLLEAEQSGVLQTLTEAGAIILTSGCGACAGFGNGLLDDGEVCISTTNRNFKGRMGSPQAFVYLASPYTVAASALLGYICDPRNVESIINY